MIFSPVERGSALDDTLAHIDSIDLNETNAVEFVAPDDLPNDGLRCMLTDTLAWLERHKQIERFHSSVKPWR